MYFFNPAQEREQLVAMPGYSDPPLSTSRILFEQQNTLWLATNRGLLRYDPTSGSMDQPVKMEERGADAYLAKPFHEAELRATLNNLIQLRRKLQQRFQQGDTQVRQHPSPSAHTSSATEAREEAFLQEVQNIIHQHLDDTNFTVEVLSQQLSLSPRQLHRKLTALTDQPPSAIIRETRLAKAKSMLETTDKNVSEVAYATGFDDPKYFSRVFKKAYGLPPSKVGKR